MVYADYEYYSKTFHGKKSEEEFNSLVLKASREIDNNVNRQLNEEIINNLSNEAQDRLKFTACALVDLFYEKQISSNKNVTSISIDGVSKTFKNLTKTDFDVERKEILKSLPDELTVYL